MFKNPFAVAALMKTISLSLSREDQDSEAHKKDLEKILKVYDYVRQNSETKFVFPEPETFHQYVNGMAGVVRLLYELRREGAILYVRYVTPDDKVWNYHLLGISEESDFYLGFKKVLDKMAGSPEIILKIEDK